MPASSCSWPRASAPSRRRRSHLFSRPRATGIIAVDLDDGDRLVGVTLTDGTNEILLFTTGGKAIRFPEDEVRPMGREAAGVRGINLTDDQRPQRAHRGRRTDTC